METKADLPAVFEEGHDFGSGSGPSPGAGHLLELFDADEPARGAVTDVLAQLLEQALDLVDLEGREEVRHGAPACRDLHDLEGEQDVIAVGVVGERHAQGAGDEAASIVEDVAQLGQQRGEVVLPLAAHLMEHAFDALAYTFAGDAHLRADLFEGLLLDEAGHDEQVVVAVERLEHMGDGLIEVGGGLAEVTPEVALFAHVDEVREVLTHVLERALTEALKGEERAGLEAEHELAKCVDFVVFQDVTRPEVEHPEDLTPRLIEVDLGGGQLLEEAGRGDGAQGVLVGLELLELERLAAKLCERVELGGPHALVARRLLHIERDEVSDRLDPEQ